MDKLGSYVSTLMTVILDKEQDEFVKTLAISELEKLNKNVIEFLDKHANDDEEAKQTETMAMNVATAAPSGRENEAKNGMNAAGFGIPGIP